MASDKRTGRRRKGRALADCRKGTHRFGSPRQVGGGMTRQRCLVCGEISIDVSGAEPPVSRLPASLAPEPTPR